MLKQGNWLPRRRWSFILLVLHLATLPGKHRCSEYKLPVNILGNRTDVLRVESDVVDAEAIVEVEKNRSKSPVPVPVANVLERVTMNRLGRAENRSADRLGDYERGGLERLEGVQRGHDIPDVARDSNRLDGWIKAREEIERDNDLDPHGHLEVQLESGFEGERGLHACGV